MIKDALILMSVTLLKSLALQISHSIGFSAKYPTRQSKRIAYMLERERVRGTRFTEQRRVCVCKWVYSMCSALACHRANNTHKVGKSIIQMGCSPCMCMYAAATARAKRQ